MLTDSAITEPAVISVTVVTIASTAIIANCNSIAVVIMAIMPAVIWV